MLWFFLWMACGTGAPREGCADGEIYEKGECVAYQADDPVLSEAWQPAPGTSWQWQLTRQIDTSLDVQMYDIDLFAARDDDLAALADRTVICYFSAGSWEQWRDDVDVLPSDAIGAKLDGWADERWFDITHPSVRALMTDRLDYAVERGCDGVEPDNVDGYTNATGFPINATEQLDFNRFLADEAHHRGLSVGLKNDLDQLEDLVDWFDWALNEECVSYSECGRLSLFTDAGKAAFHTEYVDDFADAPQKAEAVCGTGPNLDTLIKEWDLGPERLACP